MSTATQKSSESEINQLNLAMRQTPWYQDFFKQRGLNPNQVKLNDRQRAELAQIAARNGYQLGDRMKIDQAGNINQMGGFAGMPTWAKIAIAAAPVAATAGFGAAGMGPMAGMFGGAGGGAGAGSVGIAGLNTGTLTSIPGVTTGIGGSVAGSVLPSVGIAGLNTGTLTSIPGVTTGTGAGSAGSGSVINGLMKGMGGAQDFADLGSLFGNVSESEAGNRQDNAGIMNNHGYLSLQAQQDRRANESDALKKIQQAGYIKSGGTPYDASKVQLSGGRSLPSFNFPRAPITDEAKQAAGTLEQEMLKRVGPEGSYAPPPLEKYTDRGALERATNYGSMAAGGWGAAKKFGVDDDIIGGVKKAGKTLWDWFT
jgi:hypothetical protein